MDVDLSTLSLDVNRPRSPLEGSHRALDGIGDFVAAADLQALCLVGKRFRRDSRVPAAVKRALTKRWAALATSKRARCRLDAVNAIGPEARVVRPRYYHSVS